ncbi:MAG: VOC family protein [Deltaproteobacteria bacterium]|nr:VOC family protein [Deltaproteobacteria bacterium]
MLTRLKYLTLFVTDQDRAIAFYTSALGFERRADNPAPGGAGRFVTMGLPGQELQVVLWTGSPGKARQPPGRHVPGACIIETDDCRKDFEALRARGVSFEGGEVFEEPWALVAILADPDGNRIMLHQTRQASR